MRIFLPLALSGIEEMMQSRKQTQAGKLRAGKVGSSPTVHGVSPVGQMLQPGQEGDSGHKGSSVLLWGGTEAVIWLFTHFFRYLQHLLWGKPTRAQKASSISKTFAGCSHQHLERRAVSMTASSKPEGREIWRQKVIAETPTAFTCWQLSSEVRALPQPPATSPGCATNSEETQHRAAKHT